MMTFIAAKVSDVTHFKLDVSQQTFFHTLEHCSLPWSASEGVSGQLPLLSPGLPRKGEGEGGTMNGNINPFSTAPSLLTAQFTSTEHILPILSFLLQ